MSDKFLNKFFEKLNPIDFKHDKFLTAYYAAFLKEVEKNPNMTLFQFYTEYIIRNKSLSEINKNQEILKLYDEIKTSILSPSQQENSQQQNYKLVKKMVDNNGKKVIQNENQQSNKFILNKKHALNILSDYIKQSFIVITEDPEEISTEDDEKFKNNATENIIEELKSIMGNLPPPKKDIAFNRKNEMLAIWQDTEIKCNKFIELNAMATVLKKTWLIDGKHIKYNSQSPITTIQIENTSKKLINKVLTPVTEVIFPSEVLNPSFSTQSFNTVVSVLPTNSLSECLTRYVKNKTVLVCSGSRMTPGGASEQGIETNETPLYYASSYNLSVNQLSHAYPLENGYIIVTPNVLVFKDHTKFNYPILPASQGKKIHVITYTPPYKPKTTIEMDGYEMDDRMYLSNAQYSYPEKIIEQFNALFNTALFFGYETIILDDGGVEDFLLPVVHNALLFNQVLNTFKGRFKEIIFAIDNPRLFPIYKKLIC